MTFAGCDVVFSVTLLTLSFTTVGAFTSGYFQTPLDIAPNFAGSLTGMMNAVGSLTGVISPPLAGAVLKNMGAAQGWRVIFLIAAFMYFLCSIPYLVFATARIQPWNGVADTLDDRLRQVPMIQSGDFNAKTDDEPEKS
uniref:Major facilitator superfamily (MFS) profile domain-containing protein n=1 Tax=Timema shepardi TaxID=629360 RepID=A0A7R9G5Y7_TIMSH|nr:unnamed protein product [Timema shepardi]